MKYGIVVLKQFSITEMNYKILREQEIEVDIYRMTPEIIKQKVILYMKNQKNCKTVTINTRLCALRAFFNFLEREKIISKKQNPFHEIKFLKDRKKQYLLLQKKKFKFFLTEFKNTHWCKGFNYNDAFT